jgi:hypothetical protein
MIAKYWSEVARLLRMPAAQLRPSDRFDSELAPVRGEELSDELEDLSDFVELEKQRLSISIELAEIETIDGLIRSLVGAEVKRKKDKTIY